MPSLEFKQFVLHPGRILTLLITLLQSNRFCQYVQNCAEGWRSLLLCFRQILELFTFLLCPQCRGSNTGGWCCVAVPLFYNECQISINILYYIYSYIITLLITEIHTCTFTKYYIIITLHYITLHCIALHCIALHCIALHYTTLHYITLLYYYTLFLTSYK